MASGYDSSHWARGLVDCKVPGPDADLTGKVAVVTGGSNGIGAEYVRRLVRAGAKNVTIGDLDEAGAKSLQADLGEANVSFAKCSVTSWEDQVTLFQTALKHTGIIDIVIANAGVSEGGESNRQEAELASEFPPKPTLNCLNINLTGVFYTTKLALHTFQRQHLHNPTLTSVFILQGSLAGYLSLPNAPQYNASKYGVRGLLLSLVHSAPTHGTRVGYIAPWFIRTAILSEGLANLLDTQEHGYADLKDVGAAMMRLVGFEENVHGRTLAIIPRAWAKETGYVDPDEDRFDPERGLLGRLQSALLGFRPTGGAGGGGGKERP